MQPALMNLHGNLQVLLLLDFVVQPHAGSPIHEPIHWIFPADDTAYFEDVAFSDRMKYNKTRVNQTPRERTQVI